MAQRTKVLLLLIAISIGLFTGQLYLALKQDERNFNLRSLENGTASLRDVISSTPLSKQDGPKITSNNQMDKLYLRHLNHHEGHDGFELGSSVKKTCETDKNAKAAKILKDIFAVPSRRLVFCPVEKIGTTYWRRFFYMIQKNQSQYENPFDVPIKTALGNAYQFTRKVKSQKEADVLFRNSFSFMFVRNPYSRLLSAFVDKLLPPNPTYWKGFGVKAIKAYRPGGKTKQVTGHDVTFAEFVRHVIDSEKTGRNLDVHFMSIIKSCRPCQFKFDYIGKMETFKPDAVFLLDKIGLNTSVDSIKNKFKDLSVDDAILDSIYSPFAWKSDILKYISWEKALKRIWLKLQMRGIIAMDKTLDVTPTILDMSAEEFIELARNAHRDSNPGDLKRAKDTAIQEAFATVPVDVMEAFREVFKDDFRYFDYDDSPTYVFERSNNIKIELFNYTHLN